MSNNQSNIFVSTVVVEHGKVLMIREGKDNYGQRGTWNFPAGHVEYGEGLAEAAVREALEETGYRVKLNGVVAIQKKDFNDTMNLVIFFSGARTDSEQVDPEEGTDVVEFVQIDKVKDLNIRFPELIEVAKRAADRQITPLDVLVFEEVAR